ncbi:hypothetical protein D3C79_837520 [compost metagenome]
MRIVETVERRGDLAVEVPEGAQPGQRPQPFECRQPLMLTLVMEVTLLELHIGQHLAHEMRLVDLRKPLADTVGTLVQPERHRHRDRSFQLAGRAAFAQVLEQHIATQRITHCVKRRQWALGAQVRDDFCQVLAGAGMVAARQQVRLARTTAPVHRHAGPAAALQGLLQAFDVGRVGRPGQPVQHQHQRRIRLVRAMPVQVDEVAIGQPQPFAVALQRWQLAPERAP